MKGDCEFCGARNTGQMCRACCKSYDRYAFDDSSVMAAMIWAARRAIRMHLRAVRQSDRPTTSTKETST